MAPKIDLNSGQINLGKQGEKLGEGDASQTEKEDILDQKFQTLAQIEKIKSENKKVPKACQSVTHKLAETLLNTNRSKQLGEKLSNAIKEHKLFMILGNFPYVRDALKDRGWVEKLEAVPGQEKAVSFLKAKGYIPSRRCYAPSDSETLLTSTILRDYDVDLIFSSFGETFDFHKYSDQVLINRLPRVSFNNKHGLLGFVKNMQWFFDEEISNTLFPRCYDLCQHEDRCAFINDFRLTACIGILKWLVHNFDRGGESAVQTNDGVIPVSCILFAMNRCSEYIKSQKHEDIDQTEVPIIGEREWDNFLSHVHLLQQSQGHLQQSKWHCVGKLYPNVKNTLKQIRRYCPQNSIDGMMNIWIVKPGFQNRGRGIALFNKLKDVLTPSFKETPHVVQKYIERPLLIHGVKFDIRQWFLVTSAHPLIIWMYKIAYLRFSSQHFTLRNLHESIHLCNNAIQCKYKNGRRHAALPIDNMWESTTFENHLKSIGQGSAWIDRIYPGMRASFIGVLLASQDDMGNRKNSFELFGADFILTEDYSPWLLEINSFPAMAPSTPVTAKLCKQCLNDVIKVIIDRRANPEADTGHFECVYHQGIPKIGRRQSMSSELLLSGKALLHKRGPMPSSMSPSQPVANSAGVSKQPPGNIAVSRSMHYWKNAIKRAQDTLAKYKENAPPVSKSAPQKKRPSFSTKRSSMNTKKKPLKTQINPAMRMERIKRYEQLILPLRSSKTTPEKPKNEPNKKTAKKPTVKSSKAKRIKPQIKKHHITTAGNKSKSQKLDRNINHNKSNKKTNKALAGNVSKFILRMASLVLQKSNQKLGKGHKMATASMSFNQKFMVHGHGSRSASSNYSNFSNIYPNIPKQVPMRFPPLKDPARKIACFKELKHIKAKNISFSNRPRPPAARPDFTSPMWRNIIHRWESRKPASLLKKRRKRRRLALTY